MVMSHTKCISCIMNHNWNHNENHNDELICHWFDKSQPNPVSLQKMLKYANFEDWYPSGKFYLSDIFLVSEGSLGPKPPTYPAPARFFYFKVSGCFGPLEIDLHSVLFSRYLTLYSYTHQFSYTDQYSTIPFMLCR